MTIKKNAKLIKKMQLLKAPISEIFFSYQGEGIFVGQPQVFVRFSGCNLRCNYCDTPKNQKLTEDQRFLGVNDIIKQVLKVAKSNNMINKTSPLPMVSITGGEPLLYPGFLKQLLPELRKNKFRIYLETNGTLPDAYREIRRYVDVVSMDIKLGSDCSGDYLEEHSKFIQLADDKLFVKLVLTENTKSNEVESAINMVKSVSTGISFVLQPATSVPKCLPVAPEKLYEWAALARKKLDDVHVLPQMHKIWNIQ